MKRNDIKQLGQTSKKELQTKLENAYKDLENKRADVMLGKIKDVHVVREVRKDIARILTTIKKVEA
jgi:ribosomal protein L29